MTGGRKHKDSKEDKEGLTVNLPPASDTTSLLLNLVSKLADILDKNNALSEEIRQLREAHTAYETRQRELLSRIEKLESRSNT